jgi:ectoine hydroxylase-related dioxygenase (phytanoyl-CoA dioxygenase family)
MPKLLTPDQIASARRMGCVYPVRVMPAADAARYRERFEAYERATGQSAPRHLKIKPHLLFTWMIELATTPRLLDAIEDLIGPDIMLVTSAVWAKNARDPAFVTWHQDSAYFGYEPMDVWGAWVGLTDSLVEHGCLRYLPGTHARPEMPHIETWHEDNLLQRGQQIPAIDEAGAVDAEVRAGEATLHHFRLAHSSKPNASGQRRIGILFVYCPPYVRPTLGRYPARLVRGVNRFDHWDEDPLPKADLDPAAVAYFERFLARYNDPAIRSERERAIGET